MDIIDKHIVSEDIAGIVRVTDYIPMKFASVQTKSSAKKAVKKGRVFINGEVCSTGTRIEKGQVIELSKEVQKQGKIFKLPLKIIFEDAFLALVYKPPGIAVSGNYYKTVQNALPFNFLQSQEKDALNMPLPVHRLDKQTSGLLLLAKTHAARISLGTQFEEKRIHKKYNAVVIGKVPQSGIIDFPLAGKKAITKYECIKTEESLRNGFLSLLNLYPLTGRTHQLRIHCEQSGFPILGDKLYHANMPVFKGKGLFLSATEISFTHPIDERKMTFSCPYPAKFDAIIVREKKRFAQKNA